MEAAHAQKTNALVQNTKSAGQAIKAGDMEKLRSLAQSIGKAGGAISQDSAATLGNKPSQLTQLTRKAGNESGANARAIHVDRPPPMRGHGR